MMLRRVAIQGNALKDSMLQSNNLVSSHPASTISILSWRRVHDPTSCHSLTCCFAAVDQVFAGVLCVLPWKPAIHNANTTSCCGRIFCAKQSLRCAPAGIKFLKVVVCLVSLLFLFSICRSDRPEDSEDGFTGGGYGEKFSGDATYYGFTTAGNCAFFNNVPEQYDGMIPGERAV